MLYILTTFPNMCELHKTIYILETERVIFLIDDCVLKNYICFFLDFCGETFQSSCRLSFPSLSLSLSLSFSLLFESLSSKVIVVIRSQF